MSSTALSVGLICIMQLNQILLEVNFGDTFCYDREFLAVLPQLLCYSVSLFLEFFGPYSTFEICVGI